MTSAKTILQVSPTHCTRCSQHATSPPRRPAPPMRAWLQASTPHPPHFVWPQLRNIEGRSRDRELLRALTGCVAESPARRFAGEFALADERVIGGHAVVQFARAAGQDVAIKCATLRDLDRGHSR